MLGEEISKLTIETPKRLILLNPFQPSVAFQIETSHLICSANQVTGFYMKCNTGLKLFNLLFFFYNFFIHVLAGFALKNPREHRQSIQE